MLAYQRGQRVVAGAEARAQLLDGGGGRRLVRPLGDLERLLAEDGRRLDARRRCRRKAGDVGFEVARALLDQAAHFAWLPPARIAQGGMREDGRRRLARVGDGVGGGAARNAQQREIVEDSCRPPDGSPRVSPY